MARYSRHGLPMTDHAAARMQQRGIPSEVVCLLLEYGAHRPAGGGAEVVFFDKRARQRVRRKAPSRLGREARSRRAVYLVVSREGDIVTVGHRQRRIRH